MVSRQYVNLRPTGIAWFTVAQQYVAKWRWRYCSSHTADIWPTPISPIQLVYNQLGGIDQGVVAGKFHWYADRSAAV